MRARPAVIPILICLLAALSLSLPAAGCGEEEPETEVVEGEPIEIGDLSYNVQITRFLNPDDNEDIEYLVGQPEAEPGTAYLGVFMVIENETEEDALSAREYIVVDTLDERYEQVESESPYALEVGAPVPAEGQLPLPDTTAATGPNQGSLLIFEVADNVGENRPLKLEIDAAAGAGEIILDI